MSDSDQSNHGESKRHRENIKDGGDSDRSDLAYRYTIVPYTPEGKDYDPADPQDRITTKDTLESYRDIEGLHVEDVEPLVPTGVLEELADEWREKRQDRPRNTQGNIATLAYSECADELQDVINTYGDGDD